MKIYSGHGLNDFLICCGYKGDYIRDWFSRYHRREADIIFDFRTGATEVVSNGTEPWRMTLVETGPDTLTGGRVKRAAKYLDDEPFCLTYGDGVGNVDITASIDFHKSHDALVTMTAVKPESRYGVFKTNGEYEHVQNFKEKPQDESWINGGFFVVDPAAVNYIESDQTPWESTPMERLAEEGHVVARKHDGFWMAMDTLHDKNVLEEIWEQGDAPWKSW